MISDFLTTLFEEYLYLFMFFVPFLAQMGIPIGAMFFILYSGSIALGYIELTNLFFIILGGAIFGDICSYFFARKFSENKAFSNILKKRKIKKIHNKVNLFFDKHGSSSIFITRFLITGIGPYLNYVLGLNKYNFKKFSFYIFIGEILYALELLIIGYIFRDTFEDIMNMFLDFSYIILILIVLYYIGKMIFKSK